MSDVKNYEELLLPEIYPKFDSIKNRELIGNFILEILLAEEAAYDWFGMMLDPKVVTNPEKFIPFSKKLIQAEKNHVQICKDFLKKIKLENKQAYPTSQKFWKGEYGNYRFPMSIEEACLLATMGEGLGMVFMTNLKELIKHNDPARIVLERLLSDEVSHLDACEKIIKDSLKSDPNTHKILNKTLDIFLFSSIKPAKAQKQWISQLGLDYYGLSEKMLTLNCDRLEKMGLKLNFKWGAFRKFLTKFGLFRIVLRMFLKV